MDDQILRNYQQPSGADGPPPAYPPIFNWAPDNAPPEIAAFFARRPSTPGQQIAREALADIRARGDAAVLDCIRKFENQTLAAKICASPGMNSMRRATKWTATSSPPVGNPTTGSCNSPARG